MEKLYNCEFIADRYDVEVRTVWDWIRNQKLPALKIGKQYRVKEADLLKFEEERKVK
jgi:excisionase family DNA binding protein